jgi:ribosome biogenesis protein Nip4
MMVQSKPHIMQPFDLHPEFYNQPIWLSEEEKKDPLSVMREFFGDVKLGEVRQHIVNLLEVALASDNSIYADARERDAVMCFVKQLEKAIEAMSVLNNINV